MGITHFAPVGDSPGAVTSALAYFQRHPGVRGDYAGAVAQDVVVFCSHEVERGERLADDFVWNEYGRTGARAGWQAPRRRAHVIEVIREFVEREQLLTDRGHLYAWPVDVENFEACFTAVAQATLALGRADKTGRYVWANLTGGTNILNAALLEVAFLSGLIGRLYYTFLGQVDDRKYLLPPSEASDRFALDWVRTAKTQFDENYYRVLETLAPIADWCEDESLLSRLRQRESSLPLEKQYFDRVSLPSFRSQLLNRMDGREIERDGQSHRVRLAAEGRAELERIGSPRFQAIVRRGHDVAPDVIEACRRELESKRIL